MILGLPDSRSPSIYEEIQAVATVIPDAEVFLGAQASAKILREKGPRSRFIHIAAHGFFRPHERIFSGIRLAGTFLTLYDLYRLKLPAEQITLSGCYGRQRDRSRR